MKEYKYRVSVQRLSNGIFICKLLDNPVYCPYDDIKCFNTLNIEEGKFCRDKNTTDYGNLCLL